MDSRELIITILLLVAFPFYVFIVCKCAASGWISGTVSYLAYVKKQKLYNENDDGVKEVS